MLAEPHPFKMKNPFIAAGKISLLSLCLCGLLNAAEWRYYMYFFVL
jgi:hypothetical protein